MVEDLDEDVVIFCSIVGRYFCRSVSSVKILLFFVSDSNFSPIKNTVKTNVADRTFCNHDDSLHC
jgi:hypothetical protein